MIKSGEKTEEYREIKEYWDKRLTHFVDEQVGNDSWHVKTFKPFTHVLFVHVYGDDKPRIEKEIVHMCIGKPKKGWCPDEFLDKEYFVIKFK